MSFKQTVRKLINKRIGGHVVIEAGLVSLTVYYGTTRRSWAWAFGKSGAGK